MTLKTDDLRIIETQELSTPDEVRKELPLTKAAANTIINSRKTIENILDKKDDRIFVVIGPCSIHDPIAAMDYAKKLKQISDKLSKNIFIIMRVYFEKPRTTIGWKGLINDPMLDGSFRVNEGIRIGRKLLLDILFSEPFICHTCRDGASLFKDLNLFSKELFIQFMKP